MLRDFTGRSALELVPIPIVVDQDDAELRFFGWRGSFAHRCSVRLTSELLQEEFLLLPDRRRT